MKGFPIKSAKIDIEKAIDLRLKGVSLEDVGKYFGVSRQAAHKALKPYLDKGDIDLELWKSKRADLLAGKQSVALSELTREDIKNASAKDKAIVFGILHDHERLERGQSTSNVSVLFQVAEEAERLRHAPAEKAEVVAQE